MGEGFRVHDAGGAERSAWTHGRDARLIQRILSRYASRYHLRVLNGVLSVDAPNEAWLSSAIVSVANASAAAALAAVERSAAAVEMSLGERVYSVLSRSFGQKHLSREYSFRGKSGKEHHFDFALKRDEDQLLLIDTVSPHHVSIAAKYVAFADTRLDDGMDITRFAVFDRPLDADDVSLLQQVADLVPFKSLEPGVRRALH